ncbi:Gldg family protein [Sphingopyxis fribergensis]|uniref:Gldg family protein n=1 Tax=Sphingopyxis fribergensis TaxID=1515612 RepID=UPI0009DCBC20|nr:Gldg family protein [Sphingopyxis fribergensis]
MLRAFAIAATIAALAWVAGGQALLGRVDPALAIPLLGPPMLFLARWQRGEPIALRWRIGLLTLALLAVMQGLLAIVLAGSAGWLSLLLTIVAGGVAAWLADLVIQWRGRSRILPWFAGSMLVIGWFGAGHALLAALYRPAPVSADAPAVTILTGLPLRWSASHDIAAMIAEGTNDDPALARLAAAGPVSLVDSLADHVPSSGGTLLIAHPRALAPQELVAIDAFVRGGGHAVVLADALSGWPVRHPLGDPRNPPVTSLLTPLLDHWGVTLAAAPAAEDKALPVDVDGARLRLFSAGRFDRLPPQCRAYARRRAAQCQIGQGDVWLIGDADLLFTPLWRPLVPGAHHLRQADTMEWLSARLWPHTGYGRLRPLWIRARTS